MNRNRLTGLVVVGAAVVLAVVIALAVHTRSTQADEIRSRAVPPLKVKTVPKVPVIRNTLADGLAGLDDPGKPYTMVVLGDSTGADPNAWVDRVGVWLGETYGRRVVMHKWSEGTSPVGYQPPQQLASGSNPPITIWNGSAPARNSAYTEEYLADFIPLKPADVDLVVINHGHNEGPGRLSSGVIGLAIREAYRFPEATWAVMLQNPERPDTIHSAIQDSNLILLRQRATAERFPIIDVESTFRGIPRYWDLYRDNVHPDLEGEGYGIWADAVIRALKADAPPARNLNRAP